MRMLVPAPYQALVKKDKKKKKKEEEDPSDAMSGEADAQSSHEEDDEEDEEEEEDPPRKGKKRAASEDLEAEASKRDKITLPDDSGSDAEAIPKHRRRTKPQDDSPAHSIPQLSSSSGDLPPEMIESESPSPAFPPSKPRFYSAEVLPEFVVWSEDPAGNWLQLPRFFADELPASGPCGLWLQEDDGATAVETLRGELAQSKEQARVCKAAADKATTDLMAEQATRRRFEERVTEMEQKLKDTTAKCESLEKENKAKETELAKALQDASEARSASRAARK
nr:rRNA biogenesis protein RRP36-like [Aegilops tauschii subsp. strangulata]